MGVKVIARANRKTGGGLGAAFFALLLAIGLYLLPIGQDVIWAKLYQLADGNVWKAWLYLYLLSLGLITLGYWGLSAKRTKITYRAGAIAVAALLLSGAAVVASAQTSTVPTAVYPSSLEGATKLVIPNDDNALIPIRFSQYCTIALLGYTGEGWKVIDAFDNYGFILLSGALKDYTMLQIQLKSRGELLKAYTLNLVFSDTDLISKSSASGSVTFSLNSAADQMVVDGTIYSSTAPNAAVLVDSGEPGLHLASAAKADNRGYVMIDSEAFYNPPEGAAEIHFVEPQDGATVSTPFDVIVNVTWSSLFPVQEVRIGHDSHQADAPDVVIPVSSPGAYNTTLDLPEGSHHIHAYAVDYDIIQPVGYDGYQPPQQTFRIIRAEDHIVVNVNADTVPPTDLDVSITSPVDGANIDENTSVTISWNASGSLAPSIDHYEVSITSPAETANWQDVGTATSYTWSVPDVSDSMDYLIAVKAVVNSTVSATDQITVHVVPSVTITVNSPVSGANYTGFIPIDVQVSAVFDYVLVYTDGMQYKQEFYPLPDDAYRATGEFNVPPGTYNIHIDVYRNGAGISNATVASVTVYRATDCAPRIVITKPQNQEVVNITFTIEWEITAGVPDDQTVTLDYLDHKKVEDVGPLARAYSFLADIRAGWIHIYVNATNQYGEGSADVWVYVYDGTPHPRILEPKDGEVLNNDYVKVTFDWGIPANLRDHAEWKFDWYADWVVETNRDLYSVGDLAPTTGTHAFYLKVFDTNGQNATASVTFTVKNLGAGGGFVGGGNNGGSGISSKWLVLGGLILLAFLVGGRRRKR